MTPADIDRIEIAVMAHGITQMSAGDAIEALRLARLALEAGEVVRPFAGAVALSAELKNTPRNKWVAVKFALGTDPSFTSYKRAAAFLARLEGGSDG